MIQCPKCSQSLPDWSQVCQFCQTDLKGVSRPKDSDDGYRRSTANYGEPAKWIWPVYYIISIYWIISGSKTLISAIVTSMHTQPNIFGESVRSLDVVGMVVGALTIMTGIGLAAKIDFFRGVVNFLCFLQILGNLCGLATIIMIGSILGPWVLIGVIFQVLNIATSGLMIYIIGETD